MCELESFFGRGGLAKYHIDQVERGRLHGQLWLATDWNQIHT